MIKVGEKLPAVTGKQKTADGLNDLSTEDLSKGKTLVLFGVPGAFTPTCSEKHMPGFVEHHGAFKAAGVDEIVCHSVNDPFVMEAWAADRSVGDKISMFADWNAELTKALGLDNDLSGAGLGVRAKRYALIAKDGVISHIAVEEAPGDHGVSSAEETLKALYA